MTGMYGTHHLASGSLVGNVQLTSLIIAVNSTLAYLDIGIVRPHPAVQHAPIMRDIVQVLHLDTQHVPNRRFGPFAAEQILGPHDFRIVSVDMLQANLNRVLRDLRRRLREARNRPRPLDLDPVPPQIIDKHILDPALVQHRREAVRRVDRIRTARPRPRAPDAPAPAVRAPKRRLVELGRPLRHDAPLQTHVAQEVQRARLDGVGAAGLRWLGAVVDVLDAVAPAREAGGEHEARGAGADDDDVVGGCWFC